MVRRAVSLITAAVALAACSSQPPEPVVITKTVEVEVPVEKPITPPPALMARYRPEALPEFVQPNHPAATASLTPEGAEALRAILRALTARDEAWRAWAREKMEKGEGEQ